MYSSAFGQATDNPSLVSALFGETRRLIHPGANSQAIGVARPYQSPKLTFEWPAGFGKSP